MTRERTRGHTISGDVSICVKTMGTLCEASRPAKSPALSSAFKTAQPSHTSLHLAGSDSDPIESIRIGHVTRKLGTRERPNSPTAQSVNNRSAIEHAIAVCQMTGELVAPAYF